MKRTSVYKILLFFCIVFIYQIGYGNTKEHCDELLVSATDEYLARNYIKSLKYLDEAEPILTDNKQRITSLNTRALIYKDLGDYEKSMDYYLEAYKIAVEYHHYKMQSLILNNIAVLYGDTYEPDKAAVYHEKSYNVALKSSDSLSIGSTAINQAQIAVGIGDTASAERYITIAEAYVKNDERVMTYIQVVKSNFLLLKKEYSAAESLVLELLNSGQKIDIRQKNLLFLTLSNIYYEMGDIEKAIDFVQQMLANNHVIEERIMAYEGLSRLYAESGSFMLALQYKDSLLQAKDSLHNISDNERTERYRIRMELLDTERTLAKNKAKQKIERILFISILVFIIISTVILILALRIQSIRNKQRKQIAELELEKEKNQKLILEQKLKEQETSVLLEHERSNNERKEKLLLKQKLKEQVILALLEQERLSNENKQLAAKVLIQSNRNGLIEEIIHRLSKIPIQSEDSQLQLVIRQLKTQLKDSSELNNSIAYFDQINPSFLSSLKEKHPNLSATDIRFLSYLFLNFNTQEIAGLLNMSLGSCKKKRQRLANKMGVETSQLYNYLLSI